MNEQGIVLPFNEDQMRAIQAISGQRVASIRVVSSFPGIQGVLLPAS